MGRYICCECGKDFSFDSVMKYKELHGFTDGLAEEGTCCPYCGGGYEEAEVCERCGKAFCPDDDLLFAGKWCKDCLKELIDVDSFIEFLEEDSKNISSFDVGYLEQFYFENVWGFKCSEVPKTSNKSMKEDLIDLLKSKESLRKILKMPNNESFFKKCQDFIMNDHDCADNFAYWLIERMEK